MTYLTDGFHLYEVVGRVQNYGRVRGEFLTVLDCASGQRREMGVLEAALCDPVEVE